MQIPAKVKIGRRYYKVEVVDAVGIKGVAAYIDYDRRHIAIATRSNLTGKDFKQEYIADSYIHEVTHAILAEMHHPQARDEKFVTAFSQRLTKVLKPFL